MIKKDKSFMAISLGIAISSQNMMIVSGEESLNPDPNNDIPILSDDDFEIKVNTDNNLEKTITLDEYQPDPEENKTYSMGGHSSKTYTISSDVSDFKVIKLSNPNAIGSGNVISDNLNVRSGPSTSNEIIGSFKINDTVEILGKSNDWYKVDYKGKQGYVSSSYLRLNPIEKGIDVSKWNGNIDWKSVKNSGIDYVIIRAGYGSSTVDPQFKNYVEGAKNAGLKIGVYWFSYATNAANAKIEAQKCLDTLAPYKNSITYPVFFDFEYESVNYANKNGVTVTKNLATQMANEFLNTIKSQGYTTGIYTNKDFSNTYFSSDLLYSNNLWVAQYSSTNTFGKPYNMWQYSETGRVPGISGNVDLNYTCLKMNNSNSTNNDNTTNTPSTSSEKGVTTDNLNFRKEASTSSSIIATIPKNTTIEIIDKSTSSWYKIKYQSNTGYVSSKYVKLDSNDNSTSAPPSSTPSTSTEKGVTTGNLNFRKEPSISSSIITTIPRNTTIEIIDKSTSGWYKVKYQNNTGYVSSKYIQLNSNNNTTNTPSTSTEKGVTTDNLNFRKSASTSSSIIATIPKNTTIEIIDKSTSGWYKVKYKNSTGYVSSQYVKLSNNDNSTNTPSTSTQKGVTTANLNFRKSASTSSLIISTIPKNTTIEIVEKLPSGWYKVKYKGSTGYVVGSYVKI